MAHAPGTARARRASGEPAVGSLRSLWRQLTRSRAGARDRGTDDSPRPAERGTSLERALGLHRAGRLDDAEDLYRDLLRGEPTHLDATRSLGALLAQRGECEAAVTLFDRALDTDPHHAQTLANRGVALGRLGRYVEALESLDRAVALAPEAADGWFNRGNALQDLGRLDEAVSSYDRALSLKAAFPKALASRGNALARLRRSQEALRDHTDALALDADLLAARVGQGNALRDLGRTGEALAAYERALETHPGAVEALYNRGSTLRDLGRLEEAIADFERVLERRPDFGTLPGEWLHARMKLCQWDDLAKDVERLLGRIRAGENVCAPFPLLAMTDSPVLQRQATETWARAKYAHRAAAPLAPWHRHERIRVGYFSADFHAHATAWLMAELFERHDRARFDLTAISFGPDDGSPMRARLTAAFDRFVDVRQRADDDVVALARSLELDIAVDLKGFTRDSRPELFVSRCAPLQVSYLGYPGTLGMDCIDYLVADRTLIPASFRRGYTEAIAYLPDCYQANDSTRPIDTAPVSRAACGLPAAGFVYCSFNASYKITPVVFERWMRILRAVDGSVLWLLDAGTAAIRNLRAEAASRGVEPARLVFAPHAPLPGHLARHRLADLFLDTWPCNAHTTASDALWAGLPVLTSAGEAFAARVAASLLTSIGLPELVAPDADAYQALAIDLGRSPGRLRALRERLGARRHVAPLFDATRIARQLETAFTMMLERQRAGLAPGDFEVPR